METSQCVKVEAYTSGSGSSSEIGSRAGGSAALPPGVRGERSRSQDASGSHEKKECRAKVPRTYWCPECDYVSNHKGHFRCHLTTHTDERPYTCPECEMGFNRKANLLRHKKSHSQEKPLACPDCPERFKTKYSLDRHIFVKHLEQAKPFVCETCGKRLSRPDSLSRHKRIHAVNRVRAYSCSVCCRTFAYRHVAKRHEQTMHATAAAPQHDESAASTQGEV